MNSENVKLYDSKDLVTHAVRVGMTGSGKTGLCITQKAQQRFCDTYENTTQIRITDYARRDGVGARRTSGREKPAVAGS
jgi:hypothetical protein